MIPKDITRYFPSFLNTQANADRDALYAYMNSLIQAILTDIIGTRYLTEVERCPASALQYLGAFVNAGVKAGDSDRTKREKIYGAIKAHKRRGSWENDCKLRIDAITGYDARLITETGGSDWILVGDASDFFPASYYWGSMGCDGIDDGLGLDLIGAGDEIVVSGNIYIDCHYGVFTAVLSADTVARIIADIQDDITPAYMRIILGYINVSGFFTEYGRIG